MTLALEIWDLGQTIKNIFVIASTCQEETTSLRTRSPENWHGRVEVGPNNYSAFSAELSDGFVSESSNPDPGAIHTDAFTINWAPLRGYASPPPTSI